MQNNTFSYRIKLNIAHIFCYFLLVFYPQTIIPTPRQSIEKSLFIPKSKWYNIMSLIEKYYMCDNEVSKYNFYFVYFCSIFIHSPNVMYIIQWYVLYHLNRQQQLLHISNPESKNQTHFLKPIRNGKDRMSMIFSSRETQSLVSRHSSNFFLSPG